MTGVSYATKMSLHSLHSNSSNIMSLLQMASSGKDGKDSSTILNMIMSLIANHFERVESLNIDIPEKNKREHVSLLKQFTQIGTDWQKGIISDTDYADTLNSMLSNHFSMRFHPLIELHLGEDVLSEFEAVKS